MNKLFIGKSAFYKAAIYSISTKKENMIWNLIVCLIYNNSGLYDQFFFFLHTFTFNTLIYKNQLKKLYERTHHM